MKKHLILVSLGGIVLLAGAWVYAQAEGEEILACVNRVGIPRLVASGEECQRGEHFVSWNIKGDTGEQGEKGDKGDTGELGPIGTSGISANDFYFVETPVMTVPRGTTVTTAVGCNDRNEIAVAGGAEFLTGGDIFWNTKMSRPDVSKYTWVATVEYKSNASQSSGNMLLRAMCLKTSVAN